MDLQKQRQWLLHLGQRYRAVLISGVVVVLVIGGLITAVGGDPWLVMVTMAQGAFGTEAQTGRVLATVAPLLLCASGLIYTFAARLYNLGVEGQIVVGAIATTAMMRWVETADVSPWIGIPLGLVAGVVGGIVWGLLTAALYLYGRINEIFAGLGLNFVATGLAIYLIFGPWQRQGVASMSGTAPLADRYWLPSWGSTDASPLALGLGLLALGLTLVMVRGTYVGLRLRAVGQNRAAAFVLGIPADRYLLGAFCVCGALAGLAGAVQVLAVFHRLIPNISSGLGFLGLLVVLLVRANPWGILPVAIFFSALNVGSLQLPLTFDLESSLAGVIQGILVLAALLGQGRQRTG
ncbi:MAG: ABC transporter permease [Synechococcales cyanobacterium]